MNIITTATDIRAWVDNASPANCVESDQADVVARAIQAADHPPYGRDWSEWLGEHAEQIAETALFCPHCGRSDGQHDAGYNCSEVA